MIPSLPIGTKVRFRPQVHDNPAVAGPWTRRTEAALAALEEKWRASAIVYTVSGCEQYADRLVIKGPDGQTSVAHQPLLEIVT